MKVQLHWQNRDKLDELIFVDQGEFIDQDIFNDWLKDTLLRRRSEMPDGWMPHIMDERCDLFIRDATTWKVELVEVEP